MSHAVLEATTFNIQSRGERKLVLHSKSMGPEKVKYFRNAAVSQLYVGQC